MKNKNILRRFVFIFVFFSISYYSFHDFTFKTVYDNTCKSIVEQPTKVTDLSSHDTKKCKSHSLCISEHEFHQSYLVVKNDFYIFTAIKEFNFYSENYSFQSTNNLLKPPTV